MFRFIALIVLIVTLCGVALLGRRPDVRTQQATFGAGCFFGVEETFRKLDGVVSTTAGFAGGHADHPTYRQVSTGQTGHVEAVLVEFDPKRISYAELLDAFWSCHDPTRPREPGEPHRSIIFFHDDQQHMAALASRDEVDASGAFEPGRVATEIIPASAFFPAEDDHQQYLSKLGRAPSCSVGERPIHTQLAAIAAQGRRRR